ncbi:hypothetical protein DFH27DRAFT_611784 [Peziza echinospora]|nr:hypothetical protein DFH27DRAFT_611784 [Peziza echinospora]
MSDVSRGRDLRPRVTRRPSPGLAARMKMLEADAEKRMAAGGNAAAAAKLEIARSGPRARDGPGSSEPAAIVEEECEGGARNGVGSVAITSIIHTYNSQPVTSPSPDLVLHTPPQQLPPPPTPSPLLLRPLQTPTNGASVNGSSDERPVVTLSQQQHLNSPHPPIPLQSSTKLQVPLLPPPAPPTLQDDVSHDAIQITNIIVDTTIETPIQDSNHHTRRAGPDTLIELASARELEPSKENQPPPSPPPSPPLEKQSDAENQQVAEQKEVILAERPITPTPSVDFVDDLNTITPTTTNTTTNTTTTENTTDNSTMALPEPPAILPSQGECRTEGDLSQYMNESNQIVAPDDPYTPSQMLQRRNSVFSLSRASFSSQLSRLTSLALPLSSEFSERIKRMNTSVEVSNAITSSAKQILRWIDTAKSVLRGLDSEDDVEWAAQGKKSLSEVDTAVGKFSSLMQVYVSAIDDLQARPDAPSVGGNIFKDILTTMEIILDGWNEVQSLLKGVKSQVETAMEWNELWATILQDIQAEVEACQTILFEIQERRHRSLMEESSSNGNMDIEALATIVEETPHGMNGHSTSQEDASLLGLFARMQPLRASLDFLPMRLASFHSRAEDIFPSACQDLASRRTALEKKWKRLNSDAEEMRRELGEDKWVAIFRNAGKQATKMIESVERSLKKLKEAVNHFLDGGEITDLGMTKKVESYEAKRMHYCPAIQRVLAIIDKGVHDRLTVNGEILRLHSAMQSRWRFIEQEIMHMDELLHELNLHASQQLRDSVSTIQSLDARSPASMAQTPESSPASSIVLSSPAGTAKTNATVQRRSASAAGQYAKVSQGALRYNTPPSSATNGAPRSKLTSGRNSSASFNNVLSPPQTLSRGVSPSPGSQRIYSVYHTPTPASSRRPSASSIRSTSALDNRPRWNISVNTNDLDVGHNFKPLSATMVNEHRKTTPPAALSAPGTTQTRIPLPSPLKNGIAPPGQAYNPIMNSPTYKYSSGQIGSKRSSMYGASGFLKSPIASPRLKPSGGNMTIPESNGIRTLDVPQRPDLKSQQSMSNLSSHYNGTARRTTISTAQAGNSRSQQSQDDAHSAATTSAVRHVTRPASAMAGSRRQSMLPMPKPGLAAGPPVTPQKNSLLAPTVDSGRSASRAGPSKRMSMPPRPLTSMASPSPASAQDPNRRKWK